MRDDVFLHRISYQSLDRKVHRKGKAHLEIRKATALDLILLIGTMAVWGMAFIAMKVAVPETGPYWLAAARTGFGLIAVLPFLFWAKLKWPKDAMQWGYLLVIVVLNTTVPIILISWAELTLDAGVSALLMGAGPFMALFVGHLVTSDERFTVLKLIAVCMGFGGILSVVGLDVLSRLGSDDLLSQGALLLAALMYVVAGFTVRRIDLPPISLAVLTLALGTILLVPLSYVMTGPIPVDISHRALGWLVFVGVFGTGLGFVSRYYLIQKIGYSMFSIGVNLIPVFGVLFGALILGEVITLQLAIALMLVVGGLFIVRLGDQRR